MTWAAWAAADIGIVSDGTFRFLAVDYFVHVKPEMADAGSFDQISDDPRHNPDGGAGQWNPDQTTNRTSHVPAFAHEKTLEHARASSIFPALMRRRQPKPTSHDIAAGKKLTVGVPSPHVAVRLSRS